MFRSLFTVAALLFSAAFVAGIRNESVQLIHPSHRYSNLSINLPTPRFPCLQKDLDPQPDCGEYTYHGSGRLKGMKALITGGDSGLGRAIAIAYLREGASVAINYLPAEEEDANALSDFLSREGLSIERIPGDLRNEAFCAELVREAHDRLQGLDILVNNAGFSGNLAGPNALPLSNFSTQELLNIYEVNIFAPLYLIRAAIPFLPAGGSILMTSSGAVFNPAGHVTLYGSSKAALTHLVASSAQQLVPQGIRVNGVAPSLMYSPFLPTNGFTDEMIQLGVGTLPYGRMLQPVEAAPFYVDLADPTRTYASGEIIEVGGAR